MKPWERQRLEYRPKIGYTPKILSVVVEQTEEAYQPSELSLRATQFLGSDQIDNLMATASRINDMLKTMDKCLSHDPVYRSYKDAKANDNPILAQDIHLDNLADINGRPQMDVIPLLEDLQDEIEQYIDFVNHEIFDGQVDYSDTEKTRKQEEGMIDAVIQREAEGKPVDYASLRTRIQVLATVKKKSDMFQEFVDMSDLYITSKLKDFVDNDVEGILRYLSRIPDEHLPKVQESLAVEFRRNATQAVGSAINMKRAGGRDVREMLDRELSDIRKVVHEVADPLRSYTYDDKEDSVGGERFKGVFFEGIRTINDMFHFMNVEHISNTVLNTQQHADLFGTFEDKRKAQLMHQLVGKVSEEFDRSDVDREIPRFIKTHSLLTPGTYCS